MDAAEVLYSANTLDKQKITRMLTPYQIQDELYNKTRELSRRCRNQGVNTTLNFVQPNEADLYEMCGAFNQLLLIIEENEPRLRQDLSLLKQKLQESNNKLINADKQVFSLEHEVETVLKENQLMKRQLKDSLLKQNQLVNSALYKSDVAGMHRQIKAKELQKVKGLYERAAPYEVVISTNDYESEKPRSKSANIQRVPRSNSATSERGRPYQQKQVQFSDVIQEQIAESQRLRALNVSQINEAPNTKVQETVSQQMGSAVQMEDLVVNKPNYQKGQVQKQQEPINYPANVAKAEQIVVTQVPAGRSLAPQQANTSLTQSNQNQGQVQQQPSILHYQNIYPNQQAQAQFQQNQPQGMIPTTLSQPVVVQVPTVAVLPAPATPEIALMKSRIYEKYGIAKRSVQPVVMQQPMVVSQNGHILRNQQLVQPSYQQIYQGNQVQNQQPQQFVQSNIDAQQNPRSNFSNSGASLGAPQSGYQPNPTLSVGQASSLIYTRSQQQLEKDAADFEINREYARLAQERRLVAAENMQMMRLREQMERDKQKINSAVTALSAAGVPVDVAVIE